MIDRWDGPPARYADLTLAKVDGKVVVRESRVGVGCSHDPGLREPDSSGTSQMGSDALAKSISDPAGICTVTHIRATYIPLEIPNVEADVPRTASCSKLTASYARAR